MSSQGNDRGMRAVKFHVWSAFAVACSIASIGGVTLFLAGDSEVPVVVLVGAPDGLVRSLESGDVVSGWRYHGGHMIERSDRALQLWMNKFGLSERAVYVSLHWTPAHSPESRSDGLTSYVAAVDYMPQQVSLSPELSGRWRVLGGHSGDCEVRLEPTGAVRVGGIDSPDSVWGAACGVIWIEDAGGELREAGCATHRIVTLAPMSRTSLYEDVRSGTQWWRGDGDPPR